MRDRVRVLGVDVDAIRQHEAARTIATLSMQGLPALVVTANLDHAVRLRRDHQFSAIYEHARLILADGFPLFAASRLRGRRLPERVTGADLIEPICREASARGLSIFVLGTTLEVLSKACRTLTSEFPGLEIAGVHAPSFSFSPEHHECQEVADLIRAAQPRIVFVALGSPKQECWVQAYMDALPPAVYLCVGAGFDYLARSPRRAPVILRRFGFEWLWRVLLNPRRYAKRYAIDAFYLPILLFEHLFQRSTPPTEEQRKRL